MNKQELKSNLILLLTAAIWGFAFVAQRVGGMYLGPFTFTALRFALGSLSLIPLIIIFNKKEKIDLEPEKEAPSPVLPGMIAGLVIFGGASLQQVGLIYTEAGKAGFITGLYIVIVPIFGLFLKQKIHITTWIGVMVAVVGLYLISVNEGFYISRGDFYMIIGAFFWATHILVIDYFKNVDSLKLSCIQFATCSFLSFIIAFIFETISFDGISMAIIPLLYGGILSAGVAYTLQIIGQKHAKASHAAIALSMEAVFASIGGFLILHELLGLRVYIGCALMLIGMILSQYENFNKKEEVSINQG